MYLRDGQSLMQVPQVAQATAVHGMRVQGLSKGRHLDGDREQVPSRRGVGAGCCFERRCQVSPPRTRLMLPWPCSHYWIQGFEVLPQKMILNWQKGLSKHQCDWHFTEEPYWSSKYPLCTESGPNRNSRSKLASLVQLLNFGEDLGCMKPFTFLINWIRTPNKSSCRLWGTSHSNPDWIFGVVFWMVMFFLPFYPLQFSDFK